MTFSELVSQAQARLNLTSTESATRIGITLNDRYKRLSSSIGLITSRRATVQATATLGVTSLVFTGIEKIINVVDRSATPYRMLEEVTVEELRGTASTTNTYACKYAVLTSGSSTVTILMDVSPQSAFVLYADGHANLSTLSGSQVPAFAESFHDILLHGILADEYRKMMQRGLAQDSEQMYERRLSDLRMWLAKSSYLDITQGGLSNRSTGTSVAGGGSGASTAGATSYTQTGLITFDRTSAIAGLRYPFAVAVGSEKVANLDADKLDGLDSTAFTTSAGVEVLTNKTLGNTNTVTLKDTLFTLQDDGDATKQAQFQLSGVTAGQTRVMTLPDSNQTLVGKTTTDVLTNKSLTAPIITGLVTGSPTIGADLLFTDASFDIGKSAATRPRDLFLSRNETIGGTLNVTGQSTVGDLIVKWIDLSQASGGQIVFPAVQNPSAGVNTLDDYEEGTWTPVLGGSGGTTGQTYSFQVAAYTKIGKRVQVEGYLVLTAKGTITGNLQIQGLPFTQQNTTNLFATGSFSYWQALNTNWVYLTLQGSPNTTIAGVWGLTAAGATLIQPTTADVTNTTQVAFNFSYMATA